MLIADSSSVAPTSRPGSSPIQLTPPVRLPPSRSADGRESSGISQQVGNIQTASLTTNTSATTAAVTLESGACEFILSEPARCPNCKHPITEKTSVEPKEN